MNLYLYGPPGSGKSTLGRRLAEGLELPFCDLDAAIQAQAGQTIPEIFATQGEAGFRQRERTALDAAARGPAQVVALGGGALLDPSARAVASASGSIVCLRASLETLLSRVRGDGDRPLLAGSAGERLPRLLAEREAHYSTFPLQLRTDSADISALVWELQRLLGTFRLRAMGAPYDVRIHSGSLARLGEALRERGLRGPVAVVTDTNVGSHDLPAALASLGAAGFPAHALTIPAGEAYKTIPTVQDVWDGLLRGGLDRGSTVVALGGGVVGDLTGFAAATFLRGVAWVNVPTTLLAMVDSSLGGKTGVDLPQAKNLVGAFHPPRLVWTDPDLLRTLPEREIRGGLAEALKHGVIADPGLFDCCAAGWEAVQDHLEQIVREAAAVKVRVIEADPYETGLRMALNLGHTIGHGVEIASDFRLSHGEAVGIGMVAEARLGETIGITERGLSARIEAALRGLGLPTEVPPGLDRRRIVAAMGLDKKRADGKVTFALPVRIGEVQTGVKVENWEEYL